MNSRVIIPLDARGTTDSTQTSYVYTARHWLHMGLYIGERLVHSYADYAGST